jgi:hypothetical protein
MVSSLIVACVLFIIVPSHPPTILTTPLPSQLHKLLAFSLSESTIVLLVVALIIRDIDVGDFEYS